MPTPHEAIAALPVSANSDKPALRALLTRRLAYCLAASESAEDFTAVDPATGTLPLYLVQNGVLFAFDALDTTTTHDGTTCLVTDDGKRYKSDSLTYPCSVLTKATVAQPVSPAVGDRYLIPAAATGTDWAGKDSQVGIYTESGWHFVTVPLGRFLYIENETAFYHRNTSGVWTAGVGSITLGANSVRPSTIIGAGATFRLKVQNQTTNAPPGSAAVGVAYIIGPIPTGAWAGNPGKIALCEVTNTFTIYTPAVGDSVWDKALLITVSWNGSAWVSADGTVVESDVQFNGGPTPSNETGAGIYVYSDTSPPSIADRNSLDSTGILTLTSRRIGQRIRFRYTLSRLKYANTGEAAADSGDVVIGLFRDSDSAALDWQKLAVGTVVLATEMQNVTVDFEVTADDTSAHTYKIGFMSFRVTNQRYRLQGGITGRRRFTYEMYA